jgi:hypothetical protein
MVVIMAMATVRAALGLKRRLYLSKVCSKTEQHVLDDMVWADSKPVVSDFRGQMTVSQVPSQAHKLIRIFMPHFDHQLSRSLNSEPSSIFQPQTISICHGNRLGEIEKNFFVLISDQSNAATMPHVEIESERACGLFRRPMPGCSMSRCTFNWDALHIDLNT